MDELAHRLPPLIANAPCLDFTNTLEPERDRDHLGGTYAGLVRWAEHAGIVDADEAAELTAQAERAPDRARRILDDAIELRRAIRATFAAVARGAAPDEGDLARLRDAYAAAVAAARLDPVGEGWRLSWPNELARPLHELAASAMELGSSKALPRVRECAGEQCGWLFVDTTRNRSRRWCLMRYCGNAVKSSRQAAARRAARRQVS